MTTPENTRAAQSAQGEPRRDKINAGGYYKTRGDKHNLPHVVGPLEHDSNDGDAPWKACVHGQIWKWGYDGRANADGSDHNRDLVERVYRPSTSAQGEPTRETLAALAEELREYTAIKYVGDCKCGKCQLVPRALVERAYHTLNAASALSATQGRDADSTLRPADGGRISEEGLMEGTFFELPDGQVVCFNPTGRWHGWLFRRHADGSLVSVRKLSLASLPLSTLSPADGGDGQS